MSNSTNRTSFDSELLENLHYFLRLTNSAPLEHVCKSALYLLTHVPSTRHAVLEYISTFYKVASFLHVRYNLSLKNPSNLDLVTDTNNINHINQVIELIEISLSSLLTSNKNNEVWSIELSNWMVDLIVDILINASKTIAETPGLSSEEKNALKSPTILDGLDIWSNQCKPTQSILFLIQKCFSLASKSTQLNLIDLILNANNKYSSNYDWVICYFSALNPKAFFEQLLLFGLKESQPIQTIDNKSKLNRINVINFYALNYSDLVRSELNNFLKESIEDNTKFIKLNKYVLMFILKIASQSSAVLNLLLNDCLSNKNTNNFEMLNLKHLVPFLIDNDTHFINHLFNAIEQINNSIVTYDLLINFITWISDQISMLQMDKKEIKIIEMLTITFLDKLISNVYLINSKSNEDSLSELAPLLKSLNSITGNNLRHLVKSIVTLINHNSFSKHIDPDLFYKMIILLSVNCYDQHIAFLFVSELFLTSNNNEINKNTREESILIKLRQEINSFHPNCFKDVISSLLKSFNYEKNEVNLRNFIENIISVYEWDLQNQYFMSKNIASIIIERECFINMLNQITINDDFNNTKYSFLILELYNKILSSDEEDFELLKLSMPDLILISNKLTDHFFYLSLNINDENIMNRTKSLNELIDFVKNCLIHLTASNEETTPLRNILIRLLVDKLFQLLINAQNKKNELNMIDDIDNYVDENSNLFNLNIQLINDEIISHKSKLKSVRNQLIENPYNKFKRQKLINQHKNIFNFAFMNLLEIICSKSIEKNNDLRSNITEQNESIEYLKCTILSEQMCNLSDLVVQHILLDQYFIDYQWPTPPNSSDFDDSFESDVESIKLFIERDVTVQNKIENPNNNQILWLILEFLSNDEQSFDRFSPIIRSLLASLIIQWDSYQEQPTKNVPKTFSITIRLLNLISKILPKPLCYIVEIIPMLNSYETHILLIIIWRNLKTRFNPPSKTSNKEYIQKMESKHLRFIFQKNIGKLSFFYKKFFHQCETSSLISD